MKWGIPLVMLSLLLTAFAIIFVILHNTGAEGYKDGVIAFVIAAVFAWIILIVYYLHTMSELRQALDDLIQDGERIKSRQTDPPEVTEALIDRYESMMVEWDTRVAEVLDGTEWEKSYKETTGFVKPEDESSEDYLERFLKIGRNYMALRLAKLKEIRDSLRN